MITDEQVEIYRREYKNSAYAFMDQNFEYYLVDIIQTLGRDNKTLNEKCNLQKEEISSLKQLLRSETEELTKTRKNIMEISLSLENAENNSNELIKEISDNIDNFEKVLFKKDKTIKLLKKTLKELL
jgi:predicted  nucleic acid-binding Zn-ribbon protein